MGCGIAIVKYLVFIFNLVFALIGLALLVIGVLFKVDMQGLTKTFDESLSIVPTFLIIVGALIFIISFFGCCGAIRESHCMLITYGILLLVILLIQIGIGVYSFIAIKDSMFIKKDIRNEMQEAFDKYNTSMVEQTNFDGIQKSLKCCGVEGPRDWNNKIPASCCLTKEGPCNPQDPTLNHVGCAEKGYQKIMLIVKSVGYVVFGICIAEFLGIFFAFCLTSSIKNQYRRGVYA